MSSKDCQFCGKSISKENIKEHLKSDCKYVQIEISGNIDLSSFRNGHCIKNSVVKCRLCEEVIKINHKTHVNQCKNFYKFAKKCSIGFECILCAASNKRKLISKANFKVFIWTNYFNWLNQKDNGPLLC